MRRTKKPITLWKRYRAWGESLSGRQRILLTLGSLFGAAVAGVIIAFAYLGWKDFRPVEVPEALSRRIDTEHLIIHTDLSDSEGQHYALFFEGFYDYFSEEYFPLRQKRPLVMLLFGAPESYVEFCAKTGTLGTPFGFYMGPRKNTIVVNLRKGLGTATHELAHHFLSLGQMDHHSDWINEGIPTFFEKFIARVDADGSVHMSFGYFSNWRFPISQALIEVTTLEQLFTTEDQSLARSFILFLHRRKHLNEFVRALHEGGRKAAPRAALTKTCGMSLRELERKWKEWAASQAIDENVSLVPASFVKTPSEWTEWWQEHEATLTWNRARKLYVARTVTPAPTGTNSAED